MRVLIIEDEPANARNLEYILQESDPTIQIAGITGSVEESVHWLQKQPNGCDLIFMDIRLNDGLSFEIFDKVKIIQPVIFVTAYDNYALQAFKSNGIDYILKPYDGQEVKQALEKYTRLQGAGTLHAGQEQMHLLLQSMQQGVPAYKQSFLVQFRDKLLPLETAQIAWFYTAHELVYACTTENKQYPIDYTLEQLQQQLNPQQFFRANRQFIIRRSAVQEIELYFNGRLYVKLQPQPAEKVLISKARVPEFKAWMNS